MCMSVRVCVDSSFVSADNATVAQINGFNRWEIEISHSSFPFGNHIQRVRYAHSEHNTHTEMFTDIQDFFFFKFVFSIIAKM